ncbi:MAG: hypothetical protein KC776_40680 [Myxococcales bacterium]|nr:hypothetical protein [Myxococcales bacterium]MCB9582602.1 hypothetical protein [Polyangiaceae bacterium]
MDAKPPFCIKGVVYRGLRECYDATVPGGTEAVLAELRDDDVHAFFSQSFLAGGWYDIFPLLELDAAAARAARVSFEQQVTRASEWQAKHELGGVYRVFLRLLRPGTIGAGIARMAGTYYDFARMETTRVSPTELVVVMHGVPEEMAAWLTLVTSTYVRVALELAKVPGVSVFRSPYKRTGTSEGHAVGEVSARLVWR